MDLRNLCSKLDVDAMRAKIPPLPQIKLPKSMPKLKSRKIFRSSRENVNPISQGPSLKRKPRNFENLPLQLGPPASEVINRTPTRISTISSLMNQRDGGGKVVAKWKTKNDGDESFYRSAGGIDDYYPSPENQYFNQRISQPISPVRAPPITPEFRAESEQNIKMSFRERLQKGYKDVADLKFKHLFSKKTVVRTDQIEVTEYVQRFDEDRLQEERMQRNIDRDIAENYRFHFKTSRQKSEESYINSPVSSPEPTETKRNYKTVSELSGDESGMESSPPSRKAGIALNRFSGVRHTPLNMSLEEDKDDDDGIHVAEDDSAKRSPENSYDSRRRSKKVIGSYKLSRARNISLDRNVKHYDDDGNCGIIDDIELNVVQNSEDEPKLKPNSSSLYDIKKYQETPKKQNTLRHSPQSKNITKHMARFSKQKSEGDEKKRRAPLSPQQSEENESDSAAAPKRTDKPFEAIKQNFKRIQKSIKLPHQASMQSGSQSEIDEAYPEHTTAVTRTQQFSERFKRFRSTDQINKIREKDESQESPIHKITNKLQEWKKSIRKKVDLQNTEKDDDYAAGGSPQKHAGSLITKLKHIRARKRNSVDDPDDDEEGGDTYKESLAARAKLQLEKGVVAASQVPQRTMQKISDTKKYFRKKQENDKTKSEKSKSNEEEEDDQEKISTKPAVASISRPPPQIPRPYVNDSSDEEDIDNKETFIAKTIVDSQIISVPAARAMWTTKPILSDDTTDNDDELPRVLLHQDNSDVFESTLIIAVTRPISLVSEPIITELPLDSTEEAIYDTKTDEWIPNQKTTASFLEMTPPLERKLSKDSNTTSNSRGHSRKQSVDSSSEDSWIKDIPRGPSIALLNSVYENEEPWKIQKENSWDNLYKTKSIDLFELQKKHGGVLTAFEDFDDELKNTPVFKIGNEEPQNYEIRKNVDHHDRESSEELENPDDDNSSRVTKISVHPPDTQYKESSITETELKSLPYGNSRESLTGNLDDEIVIASGKNGDDKKCEESDDDNKEYESENESDRPPSKTPSPPPSIPTTPPPLPKRQPSIRLSKLDPSSAELACPLEPPPPLPLTKPPIPPNRPNPHPPKIPERKPAATRLSKPLVKTASMRLAYSEQVNPKDIGKVNKLISQFEPEGPQQKPKIIPRKPCVSNESEDYSDEDDSFEILPAKQKWKTKDTTPTNHPKLQKSFSIDSMDLPNNNEKLSAPTQPIQTSLSRKATSQIILNNNESATPIPSISISSTCLDVNSNFSQPSSVYGSPLAYPSSLIGSTEATPLTNRKESEYLGTRRNRCSMARDDEHFYSFDSDEENSYYSISSTSSNRNVVEL